MTCRPDTLSVEVASLVEGGGNITEERAGDVLRATAETAAILVEVWHPEMRPAVDLAKNERISLKVLALQNMMWKVAKI